MAAESNDVRRSDAIYAGVSLRGNEGVVCPLNLGSLFRPWLCYGRS